MINVEDNDSVTSTFHSEIPLEVTEREQRNVTCLYGQDKDKQILQVINIHTRRKKVDKKDVMPTWASTQSLLLSNKEQVGEKCVNTAAIAPLFRTSPTDLATLYTVLSLTQQISASIVGPDKRTLITLDLHLYNRAIQIQESVGNKNWILMAGGLHICFAIEHALGKTIEGSDIDTCAIECGTYSSAALRGIYAGKAFKRAVEYHIVNALAIMMQFEVVGDEILSDDLRLQCQDLKKALHERDPKIVKMFEDVQILYTEKILDKVQCQGKGDLAQYFDQYLEQLENLLQIISSCRQEDWEGYLSALEDGIKYFFAHNLNYARLMPLHIAQMNALKKDDPDTWETLKSGDVVVNKSGIPFSSLFTDQALEQEIKNLKSTAGLLESAKMRCIRSIYAHYTPSHQNYQRLPTKLSWYSEFIQHKRTLSTLR